MTIHEKYINRCIQLAANGLGKTFPNPLVGSVVVYNDKIIGEGWHKKAGEAHAEVNAINAVEDRSLLKKSTIYVSLEPCSHYGKTPPCSDLIIAMGIKKVVIGTVDPFALVAGKGIKKLMDAGCEVIVGIREEECRKLNKRFFTFQLKKRPYIILKWAETKEQFIAPIQQLQREPVWISNQYSKQLVHRWRSEEQAILVGTNTAVADNPKLNTRLWFGSSPTRMVIDKNLRIPSDSFILDGSIKTVVLCSKDKSNETGKLNENLIYERIDFEQEVAEQICKAAYKHKLQSIIIEGGSQTLQTFIEAGLWDEARILIGGVSFPEGIKAPEIKGNFLSEQEIAGDRLKIYLND